jgi:tubulin polyglutamylase TTLL1/tubulin monoglycylase TTLL3/8
MGNKLSFLEFQRYLDVWYQHLDFFRDVYPKIKEIATIAFRAVYYKLDPNKRLHNFEIFGLDFMIDEEFKPWLIEINTNPCLEISNSPILNRIIPAMLENSFKLSVDLIFPPPESQFWPASKKHSLFYDNLIENNRYQLIYDEKLEVMERKKN